MRAAGLDFALSRIVARTLLGTCSNVSGSIEYDARPFDSERIAVAYPNISASGTSAFSTVCPFFASMLTIVPRRRLMSPKRSP